MKKRLIACLCMVMLLFCSVLVWAGENDNSQILGDVDESGGVSVTDAMIVLKNVAGTFPFDQLKTVLADVSRDGEVGVLDALLILKFVAGTVDEQYQPKPMPTAPPAPSKSMALHVDGNRLVDANGKTAVLRGISTHGIGWFPDYINAACFKELHEKWKVNVIRLAMYTDEYNGYCSGGDQKALKNLVHNGVKYATDNHMYVIIDWHVLQDQNPNKYKAQAKEFFREMASRYKDYDNVLYEICNEPNGGTTWKDIKAYANEVIPVIRAQDKDGIIIVGTPNWSQFVDQAAADPIKGYSNIMYTLHFYADTHRDSLRNTMVSAIKKGLPIFVTEYGICDASGSGAINEAQANEWVKTMDQYGISYVAWNLSNKNETSAILKSSCSKTSGFTDGDLSASGKWLYKMLTGTSHIVPSGPVATESPSATASPQGVSGVSGNLAYTARVENSWESGGQYFYQYSLTVTNKTSSTVNGWKLDVPFNGSVTFSQGWNGNYSVSGSTLHITSMDYNGKLEPGQSISDIGFIVSGGSGLAVKK